MVEAFKFYGPAHCGVASGHRSKESSGGLTFKLCNFNHSGQTYLAGLKFACKRSNKVDQKEVL